MSDNKIKLNKEVIMSLEETTKFPYNYNRVSLFKDEKVKL